MKNDDDARTISQAALALGISTARLSQLLQRKGFEGRKGPRNSRLVTRADIQRLLGRTITDDAWEAARGIKARPGKRERERRAILKQRTDSTTLREGLLPFDAGWVAAHIRDRDKAWGRAALAQGVEINPPPFPAELHPQLGGQQIFTAPDVAELVAAAVTRRDDCWRHWITDSHERALHPNGPPIVGSDQFFSDNLTGASDVAH
jgi:hypothetical protein